MSLGKKVAGFSTSHGRCDIMSQNPANAIVHLGHSSGSSFNKPIINYNEHFKQEREYLIQRCGHFVVAECERTACENVVSQIGIEIDSYQSNRQLHGDIRS